MNEAKTIARPCDVCAKPVPEGRKGNCSETCRAEKARRAKAQKRAEAKKAATEKPASQRRDDAVRKVLVEQQGHATVYAGLLAHNIPVWTFYRLKRDGVGQHVSHSTVQRLQAAGIYEALRDA